MQLKPTPCDGTQTPRCETGTFHSAATGTFETATGGTFIPLYALIDGHFSQLKRMLRNHNGMKRKRRDKLVIGFFEASKGITQ